MAQRLAVAATPAGSHTARAMPGSAHTDADSDEDLMLAYAAGDAGAFDALYARHRGGLYRYFARQVRGAAAADELFQDVWMNVIRVRETWRPTAKFTTWLYTLARNRLVDHWRATGQATLVSIDDDDDPCTSATVNARAGRAVRPAGGAHRGQRARRAAHRGARQSCRPRSATRSCCSRKAASRWPTSPR